MYGRVEIYGGLYRFMEDFLYGFMEGLCKASWKAFV